MCGRRAGAHQLHAFVCAPQAEFDEIFSELGVGASLGKLDALLAAQPELPNGSRLCARTTRIERAP